jgi:hypothetical protein
MANVGVNLSGNDMLSEALRSAQRSTDELRRSLDMLNRRISIEVDADTEAARRRLAELERRVTELSGRRAEVKVDVDSGKALASIAGISMALAGLAAIPVAATVGVGVMALGGAFGAAGLGAAGMAAVAIPAIGDIKKALQQQTQAQTQSGASASASQSKQLALAGANAQLASAVRQAGYAHTQALQQVQNAEQSLAQAQQGAITAQRELNSARQTAARQLQDASNNVADAKLSERQAILDLSDAQSAASKLAADPKATQEQIKRAQLVIDQARQNLKERHEAAVRAIADEKAGAKAGVEGSDVVRSARERLAQANQQIAQSERALAQARQNVARVDQQSADSVAGARRALTAASMQGASANNSLGASMVKLSPAAQSLMQHYVSLRDAFKTWRTALEPTVLPIFAKGLDLVKSQLPSLTPLVQGSAHAFSGLMDKVIEGSKSPAFAQFKKQMTALAPKAITGLGTAAGNVAVGFGSIIQAFLPSAPAVLNFVVRLTEKFKEWAGGLGTSPGFMALIDYVKTNGPLVGETLGNIAKAFGHIAASLAPVASTLGVGILADLNILAMILSHLSPTAIQIIAVAITGAVLATKLWTAAMFAFNLVMDANPISLIVIAIGALVAGAIYAYTHFTTFRTIVDQAWAGIKAAAVMTWNGFLKPVFEAIKFYVLNIAVPYFKMLWSIVVFAFNAIKNVILNVVVPIFAFLWNNVVKPVFNAIKAIIQNVVLPVFRLLWSVIKFIFGVISFAFKVWWATTVRPIFMLIKWIITTIVVPAFQWLWDKIKPSLALLGSGVKYVWDHWIKPAFDKIKEAVGRVKDAFGTAVDGIKTIWGKIKDFTRGPVEFVVNTIYMGGIRAVWEKIRGVVPGLPDLPKVKFATGGILPGYSPGTDSVLAMLSPGEGILRPEAVKALGADFIHSANRGARRGGVAGAAKMIGGFGDPGGMGLPGFKDGGILGSIKSVLSKPVDWAKHLGSTILSKGASFVAHQIIDPLLGGLSKFGGPWGAAISGMAHRIINGFMGFVKGTVDPNLGGGGSSKAVQAARTAIGLPYTWGGGGPTGPSRGFAQGANTVGFDCSSLMEYAWYQAAHKDITRTTYSQRNYLKTIAKPVPGAVGQPHPGHTYMYAGNGRIIEAAHTGTNIRETTARGGEWWGMPPFATADEGGWLRPRSVTTIHNGASTPEALIPLHKMGDTGGNTYNITVNAPPTANKAAIGAEIVNTIQEYEKRSGKRWRS